MNFQVTVTFTERGGKTELYMQMLFPSPAAREHVVQKYGAAEGLNQTLEHLKDSWLKWTLESN